MKIPKGWTETTTYPLGDRVRYDHPFRKKIDKLSRVWQSIDYAPTPSNGKCIRAIWAKEYRPPKKGEWYLGPGTAYLAQADLSSSYFICKLAIVEFKTIKTSTICEVE